MSPSKNNSTTTASYILIVGSILSILPNIPVIDEILPIYRFNAILSEGGANFLETYINKGIFQGSYKPINSWTMLAIPGIFLWLIFFALGVCLLIIGLVLKNCYFILLEGLIGGIIELILLILIYLGNSRDLSKFGLSNFISSNYQFIGIGFWVLLIGSVLILVSGLLVLKK